MNIIRNKSHSIQFNSIIIITHNYPLQTHNMLHKVYKIPEFIAELTGQDIICIQ